MTKRTVSSGAPVHADGGQSGELERRGWQSPPRKDVSPEKELFDINMASCDRLQLYSNTLKGYKAGEIGEAEQHMVQVAEKALS